MTETRMSITQAFTKLRELGATKAVVHFSGGNDEGGCDYIQLLDAEGEEIKQINEQWPGHEFVDGKWQEKASTPETEAEGRLASTLAHPVYEKYSTFAGEFYVQGEVEWDVTTGKVRMGGDESVPTAFPFEETII